MKPEEVVKYFKGATLAYPIEKSSGYTEIWLKNSSYSKAAMLYYYETIQDTQTSIKNTSGKQHVIKTVEENYELLNKSLR
jgi:hypothetical protein